MRVTRFRLLVVIAVAVFADFAGKTQMQAQEERPSQFHILNGALGSNGFPTTAASVCVGARFKERCYTPPKHDPPFALNGRAVAVQSASANDGILFSAESDGAENGRLVYLAILQDGPAGLVPITPSITLSDLGEYRPLTLLGLDPILVTADFVAKEGETRFGPHRYEITSYCYNNGVGRYELCDRYVTAKAFKETVIDSEKSVILSTGLHPGSPPFPGLPDLDKPVFLVKGALICDQSGALFSVRSLLDDAIRQGGETKRIVTTLRMFHCTVSERDTRVSVLLPAANDSLEYLRQKQGQFVRIEWRNSDGSVDFAWARAKNLRN